MKNIPNIERAGTILGWMSMDELAWLGEQASQRENILELGSWQGRSTRVLADNTPGRVTAIDTWRGTERHAFMMAPRESLSEDWQWESFLRNVRDLIPEKLMPLRRKSLAAAEELKDSRYDMIFIDGSHDYKSVKADILAWRPLLANDGLFCGHDFAPTHMDVVKAVRELVPNRRVFDTIWYAA